MKAAVALDGDSLVGTVDPDSALEGQLQHLDGSRSSASSASSGSPQFVVAG